LGETTMPTIIADYVDEIGRVMGDLEGRGA